MIHILPLLYIPRYMKDKANGYLEVILGPMFSGKTSKIIEIYKQYSFCGIRTLVINHSHDTRYGEENINGVTETITTNVLYSHDQKRVNCIYGDSLQSVLHDYIDWFTDSQPLGVFINEGQFFPDLKSTIWKMVKEYKSHVYVAGLDGDFQREKFGQMLELIPFCDQVYKLRSFCVFCKDGTKAIFSYRINHTKCVDQTQVGAGEHYVPLCRKCYETQYIKN